jgi:hypothetical protein
MAKSSARVESAEPAIPETPSRLAAATPTEPPSPAIPAPRVRDAEFERRFLVATPPPGHTLEMVVRPDYWRRVAHKIEPWCRIECRADDASWWAELLVLDSGADYATVHVVNHCRLPEIDEVATVIAADYEVRRRGPYARFAVIRKSDGVVMREGFNLRSQGHDYIRDELCRRLPRQWQGVASNDAAER